MNPTSLGQGISWPPRIDGDGRLRLSSDADNVREAIQVILLTEGNTQGQFHGLRVHLH